MSKLSGGKEIRLLVEPLLWSNVKELAEKDNRSIAAWVRRLLKQAVKAHNEKVKSE